MTRTIQDIECAFTLSMSEARGILDLIQITTEDNGIAGSLQPGTLSGAADGAMRALEATRAVFYELLGKCEEAEEMES